MKSGSGAFVGSMSRTSSGRVTTSKASARVSHAKAHMPASGRPSSGGKGARQNHVKEETHHSVVKSSVPHKGGHKSKGSHPATVPTPQKGSKKGKGGSGGGVGHAKGDNHQHHHSSSSGSKKGRAGMAGMSEAIEALLGIGGDFMGDGGPDVADSDVDEHHR